MRLSRTVALLMGLLMALTLSAITLASPSEAMRPLPVAHAAKGLTNREIAGQLYLSIKTVEMHLGRVYRKLGITARAELRE